MFNPDKFNWRIFNPKEGIPKHVCDWILDNQSLTAKLRNKYTDFNVNVVSQYENTPYDCELKLLSAIKKSSIHCQRSSTYRITKACCLCSLFNS